MQGEYIIQILSRLVSLCPGAALAQGYEVGGMKLKIKVKDKDCQNCLGKFDDFFNLRI